MPVRYQGGELWIPGRPQPVDSSRTTISPEVGKWWFLALYDTPLLFSGLLDQDGRVLDGNRVSIEGCGLDRRNIIGRPFWEGGWWSPDPALADRIRVWCERVLTSGDSLRTTSPYYVGDGSRRMVDLALHPMFESGSESGHAYIVATGLDVTEALTARATREERLAVEAQALRLEAEAKLKELELVQESERHIRDRLSRLAAAAVAMVGSETVAELTEIAFDQAFPILGAEGGALIVREGSELEVYLSDRLGPPARVKYGVAPFDSPWPGRHVARTGERLVFPDRASGLAFLPEMAQVYTDTDRLAWVYVPMTVRGRLLGSLAVSWREERDFGEDELGLIEAIAAQCAQVVERILVSRQNLESTRQIQHMVESIQRSLLTASPTPSHLDIGTHYSPAAQAVQVGGDWYDAFSTGDGSILLVVGDVAGHDGDAAAAMAQLRNLFRGLAVNGPESPAALLELLDRSIVSLDLDVIATVLVVRLEHQDLGGHQAARWASAGHLPPMVKHGDGTVETLGTAPGLLLGVDSGATRSEQMIDLPASSTMLLYTDGLVERRGENLDVGLQRLAAAFATADAKGSEALCAEIVDAMLEAAPVDDVAILAVRAKSLS